MSDYLKFLERKRCFPVHYLELKQTHQIGFDVQSIRRVSRI